MSASDREREGAFYTSFTPIPRMIPEITYSDRAGAFEVFDSAVAPSTTTTISEQMRLHSDRDGGIVTEFYATSSRTLPIRKNSR
jgi:hypothetical protein